MGMERSDGSESVLGPLEAEVMGVLWNTDAACIPRVMGICMDQYNEVTLSIQIDIV